MIVKDVINEFLGREHVLGKNDCLTLVRDIYRLLGVEVHIPDYDGIQPKWSLEGERWFEDNQSDWAKQDKHRLWDVVVFKNGKGVVYHIGVMIGGGRFIHNQGRTGVVIGNLSDQVWKKRFAGFYRHKKRV